MLYITCRRESIPFDFVAFIRDKAMCPSVLIGLCPATRTLHKGVKHLQVLSYSDYIYMHTRNQVIGSNQVKATF